MSFNERQRYEIFVGIFRQNAWTCQSLCDYFHRLIPKSSIEHCEIFSSMNPIHKNYSFAILTFDSISSVDQCIEKRKQIKDAIHLLVKRNLGDVPKHQLAVSEYISIHTKRFDENYNVKNVLTYFQQYGLIRHWKLVDFGQTFILHFDDYDSVDKIFLDRPHFLNDQLVIIEKYYPTNESCFNDSHWTRVTQQVSDLKQSINRFNELYHSQLTFIKENLVRKQTHLSDTIRTYIHLKQNLDLLHRLNIQLKTNIKHRVNQNRTILSEYYNQIQLQRFINSSLQEIISQRFS